jgi:succinate dehydrogenase / fumarate reductase cytochrome b subunit
MALGAGALPCIFLTQRVRLTGATVMFRLVGMVSVGERTRRPPRVSSVQLKVVMAVTGAVLVLYLVAHMVGNLKFFFGAESLDRYAAWLREVGEPALPAQGLLWLVRVVLLVSVVAHVGSAAVLAGRARRARPVGYAHRRPVRTGYASRTMRWGGVIVLLFVIYHILDLTTGTLNPNGVHGEVYANVVADFSRWYVTLAYTVAVLAVGFHLRHGVWSALQTLGRSSGPAQRRYKAVALVVAVVVTAGFLAVPFAVVLGVGRG